MKFTASFFKGALFVVGSSVILSSCFVGGKSRPTSVHPGAVSTATGLAYNDEDNIAHMKIAVQIAELLIRRERL